MRGKVILKEEERYGMRGTYVVDIYLVHAWGIYDDQYWVPKELEKVKEEFLEAGREVIVEEM